MKRFFLAFLLPVVAALTSWGQLTSIPDAFYLVGSFNQWTNPALGGTDYKVLSPAADGIYSAEFEISAADLQFKIFSAETDWTDASNIWGAVNSPNLYCDRSWQQDLTCDGPNYSAPNIAIANWVAGNTLSVRITLLQNADDTYTPVLTLWCADQPAKGNQPEVSVTGSFCDAEAGRLTPVNDKSDVYTGSFNTSEKSLTFTVKVAGETGNETYGINYPPFTLTRMSDEYVPVYTFLLEKSDNPVSISDWHGGQLDVKVDLEKMVITLSSPDAPVVTLPTEMYAIVTTDEGTTVAPADVLGNGLFFWSDASRVSVLFSTENSTTPAAENTWGFREGSGLSLAAIGSEYKAFELIQGGSPFEFTYPGQPGVCYSSMTVDWNTKVVNAWAEFRDLPNQHLYLIGSFQSWNIADGSYELEKEAEGVFYGEFDVPATTESVVFRFYTALGSWESNSVGSREIDAPYSVLLPYEGNVIMDGKGSWEILNWDAETLCTRVDLNNGTIEISGKDNGGVADIAAGPTSLRIEGDTAVAAAESVIEAYNAAGILVRRAEGTVLPLAGLPAGMYIITAGDAAVKVVR